jgi:hypothetical protein
VSLSLSWHAPLQRDHPGYCTAEVGHPGGMYELPCIRRWYWGCYCVCDCFKLTVLSGFFCLLWLVMFVYSTLLFCFCVVWFRMKQIREVGNWFCDWGRA